MRKKKKKEWKVNEREREKEGVECLLIRNKIKWKKDKI